ncbi:ABC transporter ATP-binding protein [Nitriliruptoraceae bacterium ZYF776]|nr:ABC transporter ATP-binding protein [Profundirhabdus halotolerans]
MTRTVVVPGREPGRRLSTSRGRTEPVPSSAVTSTSAPTTTPGLLRRGFAVIRLALRGAPKPFAWGFAASALFAGMTVVASVVLGWVTDEVILPTLEAGEVERGTLLLAVGAIVGVALLKATGVAGRRLGAYVAQYDLQATYRRRVTRRYLELPISWHRRHTTGELLSNANADVESAFFVAAPLPMALGSILLLGTTGVLLLVTDPALAAIGFAVGPLLALANRVYQRRMRPAATVAQQARAQVSELAHESFDAALVVKTLGREAAETERFRVVTDDLRDKMIRVGRLRAAFDPVIEALPNVAILLVLYVGARRVDAGVLSPGDLVLFAYLFRLVALPMRVFGWLLGELPRAVVGWDRVRRVLEAPDRVDHGRASGGGPGGARAAMEDVGYRHPASGRDTLEDPDDAAADLPAGRVPPPGADRVAALDGAGALDGPVTADDQRRGIGEVDLEVPAGRVVAMVGPTGSGKSTVASLLVRLVDPDVGRVSYDDLDLRELGRDDLAANVAMVFQEAFLFDDTVRENIALGRAVTDDEVVAAARVAQADGFVRELEHGYDTRVGERGSTLSGGQRQRIALARALVGRPRLLVLDDATSAVDPAVESAILRGLADAELPSTVLVVAYRRGSIAMADEVLFVDDGRVLARGPHEQLLAEVPAYAQLVTAYEDRDEVAP